MSRLSLSDIEQCESPAFGSNISEDESQTRALNKASHHQPSKAIALERSHRELDSLIKGVLPTYAADDELYGPPRNWSHSVSGLMKELSQLITVNPDINDDLNTVDSGEIEQDSPNIMLSNEWIKASPMLQYPVEKRREPQSEAYRRWVAERISNTSRLENGRDQQASEKARQSMHKFQQVLSGLKSDAYR